MSKIRIIQKNDKLTIEFNKRIKHINKLIIKNKDLIYEVENNQNNTFNIDFKELVSHFENTKYNKLYLLYETDNGIKINQNEINVFKENISIAGLETINFEEISITPYISDNFNFQISLLNKLPIKTYYRRSHIDSLSINTHKAKIKGKFSLKKVNIDSVYLMITSRVSQKISKMPIKFKTYSVREKKLDTTYAFESDFATLLDNFLIREHDGGHMYDLFIEVNTQELGEPIRFKIGRPRALTERFLAGEFIKDHKNYSSILSPYFTLKGRNISFYYDEISNQSVDVYKKIINNKALLLKKPNKEIWVIGEKPDKAQDNGYHLFKYLRENYPEKEVYYVIDENSSDIDKVKQLGNVVFFQSPFHYILMTQAKYICTTHHPEHIFPSRNPYYLRRVKGLRVFLQHGVLGLKNLQKINGKQLTHFSIDLFVTSSDREKQIVNRDLLFDNNQIAVTGLPRFDRLFNEDQNVKDQILLIPTWRDWLPSQEALRESEYLERINELLNSDVLKKYSVQGTKIIFCLHPNMKQFINEFEIPEYIKAIRQDGVDVQTLIKESKLMITDYSSVGFDFSFLNKPVIYYQFDKKRFIGSQNSHIDIEAELPGYIVKNLTGLNDTLEYLDNNQFEINEVVKQKSRKFLSFKDNRNCERVVETIEHFSEYSRVKDFIRYDLLSQRVFKRYRKSKYYFNSMSYLNLILTKNAPIKKGLILFESNIGKGVADSPKVIYNKLIKLNKNFEIVWVTNKVYPFDDNRVKTVKRLSPMYYYYLSIAEFWINNQNFPHYIEKNKNTTYIQTWHGTPLKKMLNDVSEFKGRDETYKHRVNNAISRWDYLISPSSYASEKFRTAFNYKKEILEVGYPRNDQYFYNNKTKQEEILKYLNISSDKKIILYAPTFRDDQTLSSGKHLFDLNLDLFELKEELGNDYVFLLRPHVIVARNLKIPDSLKDFVINVSKYDDINDLMLITDILITDYSSVMFDFANTNKPMIFYTYDLEHYRDNLRGFYMDFIEEAPGPLVYNQEELINSIKNVNKVERTFRNKYENFKNKYTEFESGNSAKFIIGKFFK